MTTSQGPISPDLTCERPASSVLPNMPTGTPATYPVIYRANPSEDWQDCLLIDFDAKGRPILRETGKPLCGVFVASLAQVRIPTANVIEEPPILPRKLPRMTAWQRHRYRHTRRKFGLELALRVAFGS